MTKIYKSLTGFALLSFIFLAFPSIASACTYQATITGNHADFTITSDTDNLGLIQYIQRSGTSLVTKMYSPPVGKDWDYINDPCNTYTTDPLACLQNRGQLGNGAYWIWSVNGDGEFPNHLLPNGVYGLDFDNPPTYDSLGIEYGSTNGALGDYWHFCTRIGNVGDPTPTPVPTATLTPTATPTETPTPTPSPTASPTPSPSPSPSPTPSPTPSPAATPSPTPIPVTKVFFIPGLGASWNVDAFINCKNSNYSGDWTLSPYAKSVYQNFLAQIPSMGWNLIPFYYDWRQDIRNNEPILNTLINSSTITGEKVDLVGHSMGGLIARNYLETQSGGKAAKLMMVGTPNQGSALAYPTFVDGEVWSNDLIEKIGATLFIDHCSIPMSIQNLLPTYNYLRDFNTKQLKDVSTLKNKNNYLPTNFVVPFWGVKIGTLSGMGQSTLNIMDVIKNTSWPDGKPVNEEYTNEGDGTVLIQSAQITGAFSNDTINQTHSGIIESTEGINKILTFLGSPGISDPSFTEPKSALILIGYPGNFWVTDGSGVTTQSDNGMVALMNPKDGDYQLQITPNSMNTSFVIGQFMPNGQTLYKEYKFSGLSINPKVIEYNSKNTNNEILHEVIKFKNPPFPKIWFFFWNFWNKLKK